MLKRADVKERFLSLGVESEGSSPQELAATVKSEMAKWGKLLKVSCQIKLRLLHVNAYIHAAIACSSHRSPVAPFPRAALFLI